MTFQGLVISKKKKKPYVSKLQSCKELTFRFIGFSMAKKKIIFAQYKTQV